MPQAEPSPNSRSRDEEHRGPCRDGEPGVFEADRHGFSGVLTAGNGRHVVCVTAANVGEGRSTVLGWPALPLPHQHPKGTNPLLTCRAITTG